MYVNCYNYRYFEQAKIALCAWAKKACGRDVLLLTRDTLTRVPPVERQHPPHRVSVVELGKPVVLPSGWAGRVSELRSA